MTAFETETEARHRALLELDKTKRDDAALEFTAYSQPLRAIASAFERTVHDLLTAIDGFLGLIDSSITSHTHR